MAKLDQYLERKTTVLEQRCTDFTNDPDKAKVKVSASSWVAGNTGARPVRMGETTIVSDSAPGLGGHSLGPTAPEMLLGALASCLVHTYLIQAALLNIPLDDVRVEMNGLLDMSGVVGLPCIEDPRLENIAFTAHIESSASADEIQKLHENVEKYCPVLNTLRYPIPIERREAIVDSFQ